MWKPTRRNKNIGTKKSGYSKNNQMVIPDRSKDFRSYWEVFNNPVICPINVHNHDITLIVEPTRRGYVHACTPSDIIRVLELLPASHVEEVDIIILRQPKKKEEIISPVWGRYHYYVDLGKYTGAAICLEAQRVNGSILWGRDISPFYQKELEALKKDGHEIEKVKRGWKILFTHDSVRNTQLFRTLPHEFGHAVDFLKNNLEPSLNTKSDEEDEYIIKVFDSKPVMDKEEYANRYAREFFDRHFEKGDLPFERIIDEALFKEFGLELSWFGC